MGDILNSAVEIKNYQLFISWVAPFPSLPPSFPSSPSRFKLIYCVIVSPQRQEINKSNIMCMFYPSILFQPSPLVVLLKQNFY